ncbi:hypothetical protein QJU93_10045 [Pasteurella skyensis]|uniref:Uncharacterized protein n=1 Tax=Phocoenobacter skyensis TaxID=97481 RepID=A0AAJ6NBF7_9PAST|nr:hypothetical protein [Pasteurella skyensis]MDP8173696.1 hypothetical protein [Pasteurella skyensis]MDP8178064.1 hypothetical protein [Pasteurella skyensis]
MANANTKHSKELRAKSAKACRDKALKKGAIAVHLLIKKEEGAEEVEKLAKELGGRSSALRHIIKYYIENNPH